MAPVDDLVDKLKSTVDKLEARVAELEGKLTGEGSKGSGGGGNGGGSGGSDGMRMILMGPPGAGVYSLARKEVWARLGAK